MGHEGVISDDGSKTQTRQTLPVSFQAFLVGRGEGTKVPGRLKVNPTGLILRENFTQIEIYSYTFLYTVKSVALTVQGNTLCGFIFYFPHRPETPAHYRGSVGQFNKQDVNEKKNPAQQKTVCTLYTITSN